MNEKVDWTTSLNFEEGATFDTTFTGAETFETTMDEVVEVTTSDHRKLTHRDAVEQHPIEAITSLQGELGARPSGVLTNSDIQAILAT